MTNTENLKTLLNEIWKLGDRDEMSIKHIGHGLAALVALGDWTYAIDYTLPREELTKFELELIEGLWANVAKLLDGISRAEAINIFESLDIAWYGAAYLEWPEYAASEVN
jgi:hypothetical protein